MLAFTQLWLAEVTSKPPSQVAHTQHNVLAGEASDLLSCVEKLSMNKYILLPICPLLYLYVLTNSIS